MEGELLAVLNYLETERGIDRDRLLAIVEEAMVVAAKKSDGPSEELTVKVDPDTGAINAVATITVVETVEDPGSEISQEVAKTLYPDCELGDPIEWEVKVSEFGRVAAQTYRQALTSRLRQEEKQIACEEFQDLVGGLISGMVKNYNRGDLVIEFGKVDGIMMRNDRVASEDYVIGDHITVYLKEIDEERAGANLVVSRRDPRFVELLFEREVDEIKEGMIEMKGIARDAGFRSKIAVHTTSSEIDPIGSCVGMRGSRVKAIVRELGGEKVDIVNWSADLKTFVANAMQPAELKSIIINEEEHQVNVVAREDQYSLAIGKKGQNARLASKLVGWPINIEKEDKEAIFGDFEEQLKKTVAELTKIDRVTEEIARSLVNTGFLSVAGLKAATLADLIDVEGIDEETANAIISSVCEM